MRITRCSRCQRCPRCQRCRGCFHNRYRYDRRRLAHLHRPQAALRRLRQVCSADSFLSDFLTPLLVVRCFSSLLLKPTNLSVRLVDYEQRLISETFSILEQADIINPIFIRGTWLFRVKKQSNNPRIEPMTYQIEFINLTFQPREPI